MNPAKWLYNVLLGLDQLGNAIIGGSPDETISSRTGRSRALPARVLGRFLNLFEREHGLKSLEYTPWGTVDPHDLPPVRQELAADWGALLAVMQSERDLDAWPEATLDAAQRALERLKTWEGRKRWLDRMMVDLESGDRLQK